MNYKRIKGELYIPSETGNGTLYRIARRKDTQRVVCSCPDFRYRKWATSEDCKHISRFKRDFVLGAMC